MSRTAAFLALLALIPLQVGAQEVGALTLRAGVMQSDGYTLGVNADYRAWAGVSLVGWARRVRVGEACNDFGIAQPFPCSPDGTNLGVGIRLTAESSSRWWPFLEGVVGTHRYSSTGDRHRFGGGAAGVGWYLGERSSIEIGVEFLGMGADTFDGLVGPDRVNTDQGAVHMVGGVTAKVGFRVH